MTTRVFFGAPDNWCDSCCRRCALHDVCQVAVTNERRRWLHGPDVLPSVLQDTSADLHGANLSPVAPMPSSAERLERAVMKLTRRVLELELDIDRVGEGLRLCSVLGVKTTRITSYLAGELIEVWASDVVPNLLLIELALTRLRHVLEPLDDPQTSDPLRDIVLLLAPLLATVDDAARAHLSELVGSGQAPSPFLVTDGA